jgi:hypothetical protein
LKAKRTSRRFASRVEFNHGWASMGFLRGRCAVMLDIKPTTLASRMKALGLAPARAVRPAAFTTTFGS